jgi:hypothetical protein
MRIVKSVSRASYRHQRGCARPPAGTCAWSVFTARPPVSRPGGRPTSTSSSFRFQRFRGRRPRWPASDRALSWPDDADAAPDSLPRYERYPGHLRGHRRASPAPSIFAVSNSEASGVAGHHGRPGRAVDRLLNVAGELLHQADRGLASTRVVYDEVPLRAGRGAHEDRPSVILRKFSSN